MLDGHGAGPVQRGECGVLAQARHVGHGPQPGALGVTAVDAGPTQGVAGDAADDEQDHRCRGADHQEPAPRAVPGYRRRGHRRCRPCLRGQDRRDRGRCLLGWRGRRPGGLCHGAVSHLPARGEGGVDLLPAHLVQPDEEVGVGGWIGRQQRVEVRAFGGDPGELAEVRGRVGRSNRLAVRIGGGSREAHAAHDTMAPGPVVPETLLSGSAASETALERPEEANDPRAEGGSRADRSEGNGSADADRTRRGS